MDSRAFQAALDASPDAKYLLAKVKTNTIFMQIKYSYANIKDI